MLDVEPSGAARGKWVAADAQVALSGAFRSSGAAGGGDGDGDEMALDHEAAAHANTVFHTRTHLGGVLQPGDAALGYFLTSANFNSDEFAALPAERIPDLVLVKKAYPNRRKKNKPRAWRLRSIAKEAGEEGETGAGRGVVGRMGGRDQRKVEEDYELFLRDLEEDEEGASDDEEEVARCMTDAGAAEMVVVADREVVSGRGRWTTATMA